MQVEFRLKGGERVEIIERSSTEPLVFEDCSGIFMLWCFMLSIGLMG